MVEQGKSLKERTKGLVADFENTKNAGLTPDDKAYVEYCKKDAEVTLAFHEAMSELENVDTQVTGHQVPSSSEGYYIEDGSWVRLGAIIVLLSGALFIYGIYALLNYIL